LGLPSGLFPLRFPTKTVYAFLLSSIRATCPFHLLIRGLITQIMFGEGYKSLSSSLCGFLHFPVTSSLLDPNILPSTLFSTPQPTFLPHCERPSFTPIQNNHQFYATMLNVKETKTVHLHILTNWAISWQTSSEPNRHFRRCRYGVTPIFVCNSSAAWMQSLYCLCFAWNDS
jgi:hypothetical protein